MNVEHRSKIAKMCAVLSPYHGRDENAGAKPMVPGANKK